MLSEEYSYFLRRPLSPDHGTGSHGWRGMQMVDLPTPRDRHTMTAGKPHCDPTISKISSHPQRHAPPGMAQPSCYASHKNEARTYRSDRVRRQSPHLASFKPGPESNIAPLRTQANEPSELFLTTPSHHSAGEDKRMAGPDSYPERAIDEHFPGSRHTRHPHPQYWESLPADDMKPTGRGGTNS